MEFFDVFLNKDTIHTLTLNQKMFFSLVVTVLGMGITFVGLIVIQYMIGITSVIVRGIEKRLNKAVTIDKSPALMPEVIQVTPKAVSSDTDELNEELVAVITAAIAASLQTHTSNIVVKNIRRVSQTAPAWATAGRSEQLGSRF